MMSFNQLRKMSFRALWLVLANCLFMVSANATVTLKVLEWEGYVSPFIEEFEAYAQENGMDVELEIVTPYITNPAQIFEALRRQQADVVTPTHNYFKMGNSSLLQVLQPIDTSRVSNYSKVLSSLRSASYDQSGGNKYSVPLLGGSYGLAYNADRVSQPDSWEVLWQPSSANNYAVTDDQFEANFYITMLALGYSPESFYDVENRDFNQAQVQGKLTQLVENAHSFWGGMADPAAMRNLDYVTTYWFGVAAANSEGQNWRLANPEEGQTVWLDTLSIGEHVTGDTLDAAYLLIDFMISEQVQKQILEMYGSIIVNGETASLLTPEQVENGRVGDESFFVEAYFWKPLNQRTRNIYQQMWRDAREQ